MSGLHNQFKLQQQISSAPVSGMRSRVRMPRRPGATASSPGSRGAPPGNASFQRRAKQNPAVAARASIQSPSKSLLVAVMTSASETMEAFARVHDPRVAAASATLLRDWVFGDLRAIIMDAVAEHEREVKEVIRQAKIGANNEKAAAFRMQRRFLSGVKLVDSLLNDGEAHLAHEHDEQHPLHVSPHSESSAGKASRPHSALSRMVATQETPRLDAGTPDYDLRSSAQSPTSPGPLARFAKRKREELVHLRACLFISTLATRLLAREASRTWHMQYRGRAIPNEPSDISHGDARSSFRRGEREDKAQLEDGSRVRPRSGPTLQAALRQMERGTLHAKIRRGRDDMPAVGLHYQLYSDHPRSGWKCAWTRARRDTAVSGPLASHGGHAVARGAGLERSEKSTEPMLQYRGSKVDAPGGVATMSTRHAQSDEQTRSTPMPSRHATRPPLGGMPRVVSATDSSLWGLAKPTWGLAASSELM